MIVTDGESHDFHKLESVIAKCEKDGIERFGIAVGIYLFMLMHIREHLFTLLA